MKYLIIILIGVALFYHIYAVKTAAENGFNDCEIAYKAAEVNAANRELDLRNRLTEAYKEIDRRSEERNAKRDETVKAVSVTDWGRTAIPADVIAGMRTHTDSN